MEAAVGAPVSAVAVSVEAALSVVAADAPATFCTSAGSGGRVVALAVVVAVSASLREQPAAAMVRVARRMRTALVCRFIVKTP